MTARVIDASKPGSSSCLRLFVQSASDPGSWRRVDFVRGGALTCSCPRGRAIARGATGHAKGCRHLIAATEYVQAKYGAVAS